MALSTATKYKIIRLLGMPAGTLDSNSLDYSNVMTRRLSVLQVEAEVEIQALLDSIAKAETQMDKYSSRAGVKSIDDIEFFENGAEQIRAQRNRYVRELGALIGVAPSGGSSMGCVIV